MTDVKKEDDFRWLDRVWQDTEILTGVIGFILLKKENI